MSKKYKLITDCKEFDVHTMEGHLSDVLSTVKGLIAAHGDDGYLTFTCDEYNSHFSIRWYRQETDAERDARLKSSRKQRERNKQLEAERAEAEYVEYLKLREKYEHQKTI